MYVNLLLYDRNSTNIQGLFHSIGNFHIVLYAMHRIASYRCLWNEKSLSFIHLHASLLSFNYISSAVGIPFFLFRMNIPYLSPDFFSLAQAISTIYLLLFFNLMRYAFFILHLKTFFRDTVSFFPFFLSPSSISI